MEIVRWISERNEWVNVKKRKRLMEERGFCCNKCKKHYDYMGLEIDHIIPCCLGGVEVELVCKGCHKKKTKFDINFIYFLKKEDMIIITRYDTIFEVRRLKVIELYKQSFKLWEEFQSR